MSSVSVTEASSVIYVAAERTEASATAVSDGDLAERRGERLRKKKVWRWPT
jgi:hypothetical protein